LLAIFVNAHLHRPLTTLPPAESVANIQIFLSVTAIPLMCLAAVIEERRRFNEALAERLRFEELLVRLSSTFVHLPSQKVATVFEASRQQLGLVLGSSESRCIVSSATPMNSLPPTCGASE
jgi:hypothetical protein